MSSDSQQGAPEQSSAERERRQREEILNFVGTLHEPGEVVELRALEYLVRRDFCATGSGYYNDWEALARDAISAAPRAKGTYVTANLINPALLARRANEFHWLKKTDPATSDHDVTRRRWLPVDLDPVRPSGICSTQPEHEAALEKAREIGHALSADGWPTPMLVDTGNGATAYFRVDLPPDDGGLLSRVLEGLAFRFDSATVKVDLTMHNPARIIRLPGTPNRKGSHTLDRPHRWCRIIEHPGQMVLVSQDLLEAVAGAVPDPGPRNPGAPSGSFDLETWVRARGLTVEGPEPWKDSAKRWVFPVCPFDSSHTNRSAYLIQFSSGAIAAGCHHNGCSGKRWHDLRDTVEPGWRDAKQNGTVRGVPAKVAAAMMTEVPRATTTGNERNGFKVGATVRPRDRNNYGKITAISSTGAHVYFVNDEGGSATVFFPFGEFTLAHAESAGTIAPPTGPQPPYKPFPIAALPALLAEYVTAVATSIGCDETLAALPCLSTTAGAIGNTRALILKASWLEPCVLWTAPTARSGGGKSPAFHHVLHAVAEYQAKALAEYREEHRKWTEEQVRFQEAMLEHKKHKGPAPKPLEPEPRPVEFLVDDITTESLALKLRDNPRGLLGAPEELSGYFGSLDAYKKAHLDASRYLRMYDAKWMKVDRKTGDKADRIIFIRRAAVSMTGTIQTGILARCASPEHFESGMMARFIIAQPPLNRPAWNETVIPAEIQTRVGSLFARLYSLEGLREEGEEHLDEEDVESIRPYALSLTPKAKSCWVDFFNEFRFEEDPEDLQQSSLWAKTVGRAARLALVHHVITEVCAERDATAPVQLESMEAGITIARWSLGEGERIYWVLRDEAAKAAGIESTPEVVDEDAELLRWIRSRGGAITPRDLQRGPRRFRKGGVDPEAVLQALVTQGIGTWSTTKPEAGPGRPTRTFVLSDASRSGDTIPPQGDTIREISGGNTYSVAVAASPGGASTESEPRGREPGEDDGAEEQITWEA